MDILISIGIIWWGTVVFFIAKDAANDFLDHLGELSDDEIKRKKENIGYVLLGSAVFGLLVGITGTATLFEIIVRITLAIVFGIMSKNLIKGK